MKCPECDATKSKVLKTLIHEGASEGLNFGELKKRKRRCLSCRSEFFSYEVTENVFRKMRIPKRRPLKTNLDLRPSHV